MSVSLTIRDETTDGRTTNEFVLDVLTERITVRELIRSRVYQEVQDHNLSSRDRFTGLVQPVAQSARTGAGTSTARHRPIDWQEQFQRALAAFESRQLLILVGNTQVERLDEEIVLAPRTEVSFLKLTPLVGG